MDVIDVTGESRPAPPPKESKGYLAIRQNFGILSEKPRKMRV